jgi:hypothetical protein
MTSNSLAINDNFSYSGSLALALLALTLSFDAVAITYAISKILPQAGLRNWLQGEYWEITKTVLIIVSIYAILILVGNITNLITPSATGITNMANSGATPGVIGLGSLVGNAETYLCQVNDNVINAWELVGIMSEGVGFWSTFQVKLSIPIPLGFVSVYLGMNFLPFANWALQTGNYHIAPFFSVINDIVNFILFPYTTMELSMINILPALVYVGLSFFIPLGLALRALPFVRGIGGTLLAIGVAMSVVMPAVLVLFNYPITQALNNAIDLQQPAPPTLTGGPVCAATGFALSPLLCAFNVVWPILFSSSSIPGANNGANLLSAITYSTRVFDTNAMYFFLSQLLKYGLFIIVQFVLLAMDLIIVYPIVDNLARMFGGSIKLSLGNKMRLAH